MTNCPIHVVMLIQVYLPHIGGAERQLHSLAPLLQKHNIKVSIVTRRLDNYKWYEEIDGVPVYRLPALGFKALASILFSVTALPLLVYLKPDLIHVHELLSPATTAVMAKPFVRKPIVAKLLRGGSLGDLQKLKRKAMGHQRIERFRKNIDKFIAISHEIENELEEVDINKNQYVFIPNGVDSEKFGPIVEIEKQQLRQQLNLPQQGKYVIFTGRIDPEKRIDLLIEIWSRILEQHPSSYLLLVGTGSLDEEYKQIAGENIIFTGRVENIHQYLQASDIFVLPSMSEGLSNALLEGMSTGLAAIATAVGGTPDVIEHLQSGYVIQPGDKDGLYHSIETLLSDDDLRQKLGRNARAFVQQHYSLQMTADKLNQLYRTLIGKT